MSFDGQLASQRILAALLARLEELPEFDAVLLEKLNREMDAVRSSMNSDLMAAERELLGINQKVSNLSEVIANAGLEEILIEKLQELKSQRLQMLQKIRSLKEMPEQEVTLPPMATLKQRIRDAFQALATESPEFGELMRKIITDLRVFPYRICDGNRIVQRATFTINLVPFLNMAAVPAEVEALLRHDTTVDLFDPPQRVLYRERTVSLLQNGLAITEAAKRLGVTLAVAQNALKLHRVMEKLGLTDPFLPLTEPPADDTKMKRHLHPRYRFTPLKSDQAN